jgi:DMSO/TMAO reductase YedYZ molybdopterin-dependent catalytic subunit
VTELPDESRPYGRRAFLALLAGGVSSLAWAGPAAGIFSPLTSQFSQLLGDLLPIGGWRIYTISGSMPLFDERVWRLEINGLVERPVSLTYAQVRDLPQARQVTDFHCVTGWSVGHVGWQGVRLQALWDMAKPTSEARYANFISLEHPYVDTLTFRQTTMPQVMLAHSMGGKPLSQAHGAPMRLVIPEMYGYKNVKWLTHIELVPKLSAGFWEQRGYDVDAWVGRSNGY